MTTDEKVVKTGYTITMSVTKYKKLVTCHHGAKVVFKAPPPTRKKSIFVKKSKIEIRLWGDRPCSALSESL